jgi:hypothetical protein
MGNQVNSGFKNCCTNEYAQNKKEVDIDGDNRISPMDRDVAKFLDRKQYKKTNAGNPENINFPFKKPENIIDVTYNDSKDFDRIKYIEQITAKAPRLVLKVVNSTTLTKGTTLAINAQGLDGSLRSRKDGVTYFGCKKKSKPLNENFETAEVLNDFIIRNKDPETNDRHRGRHFQIEYCIDSNSYKIKDLGIGFGAFVKIDHPLVLKDNNLLSMGSSFLIINFTEELRESLAYSHSQDTTEKEDRNSQRRNVMNSPVTTKQITVALKGNETGYDENKKSQTSQIVPDITIKIFGGPNYGDVYQFSASIAMIKIGRMPDCEIRIEDNLLSKYQSSIKYVPGSGWTLFDGYNGKPSTNSNWLYLNDDFEMYNNMVFKANHTLFQVNIENGTVTK